MRVCRKHGYGVRMTRLAKAIQRLAAIPDLDYRVLYPCTILKDHGGNKFDVRCDDERLGNLVRIRLLPFAPGAVLRVPKNTRGAIGFLEGKPSQPALMLWERGSSTRITLGQSAKDAARKGDTVKVTIPPNTVLIQVPNPAGVPPFLQIPNPAPIELTGEITSGSSLLGVADA
jgi:hypothetical protein